MSGYEPTFQADHKINGKVSTTTAGVVANGDGRFSPWVKGAGMTLIIPRRVPMTRDKALLAAEALGRAMETVVLLSMEQLREDAYDRSKKCDQL